MANDPLSDALRSLVQSGAEPQLCRRVLAEVRRRWVGQCYIRAVDREARNAEIQAALQAGEPVPEVAKKVNTSAATIRRVRRERL